MQRIYEETNIQAIADAIRAKNGTTTTYKTSEMAAAIEAIETGGSGFWDEETVRKILSHDTSVTSVTIPDGVTQIHDYQFNEMSGLNSINLPESITKIGYNAFYNTALTTVIVPNSVEFIGSYAFSYCKSLQSIVLPTNTSFTWLYSGLFFQCTNLESVTIPNNVKITNSDVFAYCSKLTSLVFPASITHFNEGTVNNCSALASVTFKGTPTYICDSAFKSCDALTDIYVPFAEGTISGAPWGATNATVHYNSTV